jgi:hypothetical protein
MDECYNKQFLSIKSGCCNEHRWYKECGEILFTMGSSIQEIQAESQRVLDSLTEKDFQEAFQKWRRWWDRCLHAGGNYFEGDGGR